MKKHTKHIGFFVLLLLCTLLFAAPVLAAPKYTNQWVVNKKGRVLYYDANGKKTKGLAEINGKTYYFDKKGFQHVGWQKIGKKYYYFKISSKAKASMVTGKKINGIKLTKSGTPAKSASSRKLKLLWQASQVVETVTKNSITTTQMTKKEKLRKCFTYMLEQYRYTAVRPFTPHSHWDYTFAEDIFDRKRGDCVSFGAAFAYLANALGYKANAVCSGGHAWAEIGNYFFDPTWALVENSVDRYFYNHYDLSGQNGRPYYRSNRTYVIPV